MAFLAGIPALVGGIGSAVGAVGSLLNPNKGAGFQAQAQPSPFTAGDIQAQNAQAQQSLQQQQNFVNALQSQNGLGKQTDVYGQMANVAAGQGPNPAQAMLAQATGQNVAQQNAMMAGQRGAGANVGMMARQAGQVGGAAQQAAAGQAATMQANQSLNALGQMGGLANTMAGQQQSGVQNMTAAQQAQLQQMTTPYTQAGQTAMTGQGYNAQIAKQNAEAQIKGLGGATAGMGTMLTQSGLLSKDDSGGGGGGSTNAPGLGVNTNYGIDTSAKAMGFASGGFVDTIRSHVMGKPMALGGPARNFKPGGKVPGQAKVRGDSYSNDTVPAVLSPGEVVIPRSVMGAKDPSKAAAAFVAATLAKKRRGLGKR